jgi:4-hydroxybenzoate polyprenyltransferase
LKVVQKTGEFFIYSNFFIAVCAVLMANQTYRFLLHSLPDLNLIHFIFFATLCSYSFHWYFTSHSVIPSLRIKWTLQNRNIHLLLFFIGLTGSGIFFFLLSVHWYWLLLASIITFLYSAPKIPHPYFRALRKAALGKTIFLAVVWMYVTTILPIIVSEQAWKPDFTLFVLSRFFLVYAICILFDLRDREDDKADGIRSLITFLSPRNVFIAFVFTLCLFAIVTAWLLEYDHSLLSILLLLLPGIIVACLYNYAKSNFSDMLYYFLLDGLMALSALLMLIPGI